MREVVHTAVAIFAAPVESRSTGFGSAGEETEMDDNGGELELMLVQPLGLDASFDQFSSIRGEKFYGPIASASGSEIDRPSAAGPIGGAPVLRLSPLVRTASQLSTLAPSHWRSRLLPIRPGSPTLACRARHIGLLLLPPQHRCPIMRKPRACLHHAHIDSCRPVR